METPCDANVERCASGVRREIVSEAQKSVWVMEWGPCSRPKGRRRCHFPRVHPFAEQDVSGRNS